MDSGSSEASKTEMSKALWQQGHQQTEVAVALLVKSHGLDWQRQEDEVRGPGGERHIGTKRVNIGGKADFDVVRAVLRKLMSPPTEQMTQEALAELSVITARRADSDLEEALRLEAYTRRLVDYPADVVRQALLVHRWKFWPTWAELAACCDALVSLRVQVINALDRGEDRYFQSREIAIAERLRRLEADVREAEQGDLNKLPKRLERLKAEIEEQEALRRDWIADVRSAQETFAYLFPVLGDLNAQAVALSAQHRQAMALPAPVAALPLLNRIDSQLARLEAQDAAAVGWDMAHA